MPFYSLLAIRKKNAFRYFLIGGTAIFAGNESCKTGRLFTYGELIDTRNNFTFSFIKIPFISTFNLNNWFCYKSVPIFLILSINGALYIFFSNSPTKGFLFAPQWKTITLLLKSFSVASDYFPYTVFLNGIFEKISLIFTIFSIILINNPGILLFNIPEK